VSTMPGRHSETITSPLGDLLRRAVSFGLCSQLAIHYYDFFKRLAPEAAEVAWVSGALAVQAVLEGHSCLMLTEMAGKIPFAGDMDLGSTAGDSCRMPDSEVWQAVLMAYPFVGGPDSELTPLVLDRHRLYLRRYFDYECRLAAAVARRSAQAGYSPEQVAPFLAQLFLAPVAGIDWQKVAVATAAMRRFCLITGGPGTGKTHTVVRIVALLQALSAVPLRIGLAAPTGKAASRLQEALAVAESDLATHWQGTSSSSTIRAQTIHRLLGTIPNSPHFRHNPQKRLPLDVLIVDEVSMVDLALMTKLIEAMPDEGRLVLLGDKDQLSSVEAGRVLADLCAGEDGYSPAFAHDLRQAGAVTDTLPNRANVNALTDCRVVLRKSYRFQAESGIGALASVVLAGDGEAALATLARGSGVCLSVPSADLLAGIGGDQRFVELLCQGYGDFLAAIDPVEALAAFRMFQVLCVHRHGENGSLEINAWFESVLETKALIRRSAGSVWYPGRPVMITGNHYALQLFNGDVGVAAQDQEGKLRIYFEGREGLRSIAPSRVPSHETAFALTVHKAQGSEFDRVVLLLPNAPSRLVTRELIYTAITRAKKDFEIWGREESLVEGISTKTIRYTGLHERCVAMAG